MSLLDTDQVAISDSLQMISQWHEVKTFAAERALNFDVSPRPRFSDIEMKQEVLKVSLKGSLECSTHTHTDKWKPHTQSRNLTTGTYPLTGICHYIEKETILSSTKML